jgi:poly(3-hydroxybutyrate) depolymerase
MIVQRAHSAPFLPVELGVVAGWVKGDRCTTKSSNSSTGYTVVQYGGYADGAAITFITVTSGGHNWFKAPIDASSTIWNFLQRFSK